MKFGDEFEEEIDEIIYGGERVAVADEPSYIADNGVTPQIEQRAIKTIFRDDFDEAIKRFHKSFVGPRGEKLDDFDAAWQEKQRDRADANPAAAQVGNPKSACGAVLGSAVTMAVGDPVQNVVWWVGENEETLPVTVTMNPVNPILNAGNAANKAIRPFFNLRWGTRAPLFLAELDAGQQVTVCASAVAVEVGLDVPSGGSGLPLVQLAAAISFHPMLRTAPTIRSKYIDSLAPNATAPGITIPPFAQGLLPVQMSDISGSVELDFFDSSGNVVAKLSVPNGSMVASLPITSDMVQVTVKNTGPNTQTIRLPFELGI